MMCNRPTGSGESKLCCFATFETYLSGDRFLEDVAIRGRLTGTQRAVAGILPMTMGIGLSGMFVSRAIEKGMKKKKGVAVGQLIDVWNQVRHASSMFFCVYQVTHFSILPTIAILPSAPDGDNPRSRPNTLQWSTDRRCTSASQPGFPRSHHVPFLLVLLVFKLIFLFRRIPSSRR
jgi:hypothetical protein